MKRILAFLIALTLVLTPALALAEAAEPVSLTERGLDLIRYTASLASDPSYVAMYSASQDVEALVSAFAAGSYDRAQSVYLLSFSDSALTAMAGDALSGQDMTPAVREYIRNRLPSALLSSVNARQGVNQIAAASILSQSRLFVDEAVTEPMIYIYVFDDSTVVAVTFTPGEGGAVSASGTPLFGGAQTLDALKDVAALTPVAP